MNEKNFWVKNFSLILPKKHCLITQNQFWPFLGVLSGFVGVHQNFGDLNLYFENSFSILEQSEMSKLFCKETKPMNINLLVFLGGMGSFMIICLHKWANMHIGDFKDMIALVASTSHFIFNISNPICGLYFNYTNRA